MAGVPARGALARRARGVAGGSADHRDGSPIREPHVPLAADTQLPPLRRRPARLVDGKLDATRGPGLAGAAALPQQRLRHRDHDRAAIPADAAVRLARRRDRRSLLQAQAHHGDTGVDGPDRPRARPARPPRRRHLVRGLPVRVPARHGDRGRQPDSPGVRLRARGPRRAAERGRAQQRHVQRRPHRRPGGGGTAHRRDRHRLGLLWATPPRSSPSSPACC